MQSLSELMLNKCESIFADVKKQAKLMEETLIEKAVTDSRAEVDKILANAKSECLKIEKLLKKEKVRLLKRLLEGSEIIWQ